MNEKITVFPKSSFSFGLVFPAVIFPIFLIIVSFLVLLDENNIIVFVIGMAFALIMGYFGVKMVIFYVSFIDNRIISPKHYCQNEPVDIRCDQLLTCLFGFEDLLRLYMYFDCKDGKERKIYASLFSENQLLQIVELIKERGGLREQSIEEIMGNAPDKGRNE